MYFEDVAGHEGEAASVIGKFERLEDGAIVLKFKDKEVYVKHSNVDSYRSGFVLVCGTIENGMLKESSVHPIGSEFDADMYHRFINVASKYPGMF
ncbi:putative subunit RPA3 of replication protein A [Ordospora colligata]|uniref:Putative subunit RPA3 of replication protein A n=1 Tax=Ordospora colligata OC4 TaxID=1354746 RepID=A0A0B2UE55_9MICR|nr:putative subunit RPA3 of replication protein A [Ordospora colligata OC4]KHN69356.1 putative subunit RPA3 of replication protein A [Ordospora colligata OC4]TBU14870.1 putative subunit RPA3 of replication protein A [Ordospora colligata]TBU15001.1 putative subunit RPA3 of replication protein A [Ordospora colligata]TBU18255.1 putative subunit RPA3 of replication protein A [Ordospora colligata]